MIFLVGASQAQQAQPTSTWAWAPKPAQLTPQALDQFNTALSHARMAREALGSKPVNIVYAQELANKALTLARQLTK